MEDTRTWSELPFDELAKEAASLARRTGDTDLAAFVSTLKRNPSAGAAEIVIHRIETAHAA